MGLFTSINIAATGMSAERLRSDVISDNIANAFASIVDVPVYAADGKVQSKSYWSHEGDCDGHR